MVTREINQLTTGTSKILNNVLLQYSMSEAHKFQLLIIDKQMSVFISIYKIMIIN